MTSDCEHIEYARKTDQCKAGGWRRAGFDAGPPFARSVDTHVSVDAAQVHAGDARRELRIRTTMAGLSAKARSGHGLDRLLASARLAGLALAQALPA